MVTMGVVCMVEPLAFCSKMRVGACDWRGWRKKMNGNDEWVSMLFFWLARIVRHNKAAES